MMAVNFFTSSMNSFLDVVIFALPIPSLYKLQITRQKKGKLTKLLRCQFRVDGSQYY